MKTNWSSTWTAIYQSPAAETVFLPVREQISIHFNDGCFKNLYRSLATEEKRDTEARGEETSGTDLIYGLNTFEKVFNWGKELKGKE